MTEPVAAKKVSLKRKLQELADHATEPPIALKNYKEQITALLNDDLIEKIETVLITFASCGLRSIVVAFLCDGPALQLITLRSNLPNRFIHVDKKYADLMRAIDDDKRVTQHFADCLRPLLKLDVAVVTGLFPVTISWESRDSDDECGVAHTK